MKESETPYKGPEKRHTRRKLVKFHADIIRVNAKKLKGKWDHEVGIDIGLGGFGIRSAKPLPEKANVTVAILLPDGTFEVLELDAKLVWTEKVIEEGKESYFMGLEFTKLDAQAQERIDRFVRTDP